MSCLSPAGQRLTFHFFVILAVVLNATLASHGSVAGESNVHRILSCNIRNPQPADEQAGDGWKARQEMCAAIIASRRADIICLQECRPDQRAALAARWPEYDGYGLFNPGTPPTPNNWIFYLRDRYELLSGGGFWLSQTPHVAGSKSWDSAAVRFANWVLLRDRATKKELRVWNTHFDHQGHKAREEAARLMVEASEGYDAPDVPQILVGDLNAPQKHPAIQRLLAGGFTDTYAAVHGPGDPGHTFHGFLGARYLESRGNRPAPGRIDWIFTRGNAEARTAEVIRDGQNGRYPSDHYFVSADVALRD